MLDCFYQLQVIVMSVPALLARFVLAAAPYIASAAVPRVMPHVEQQIGRIAHAFGTAAVNIIEAGGDVIAVAGHRLAHWIRPSAPKAEEQPKKFLPPPDGPA